MSADIVRMLWCLLRGDTELFKVEAHTDHDVFDLKTIIHKQGQTGTLPKSLRIWKLNAAEPIDPFDTLLQRILSKSDDFSQFAVELKNPADTVLAFFPQHPLERHLHLIVQILHAAGVSPNSIKSNVSDLSDRSDMLGGAYCPRTETVSALYRRLNRYKFIQVRGTPASGKTTLSLLLSKYVKREESQTQVFFIGTWPKDTNWRKYLTTENGWKLNDGSVLIIDEAQRTYEDSDLWDFLFKAISANPEDFQNCIILFSSYGSPAGAAVGGTPMVIPHCQNITLRSVEHNDGITPIRLFLTSAEFKSSSGS